MSRLQAGGLAKAVDLIYEAALRPELWRYALNTVAEVLGSDNIVIFADPNTSAHWAVWSEGNDELVDWFFREGWHLKNPRPERALKRFGMMRVVTEADMFTPWELDNLPFNQAMIHQMGYRWDAGAMLGEIEDRKSTRLNSSHVKISYAVFCVKKETRTYEQLVC